MSNITPEMIEALDTLRSFAHRYRDNTTVALGAEASAAINTLDNADFFAPIDDAREDEDPDSTRSCGCGAIGIHGIDHPE